MGAQLAPFYIPLYLFILFYDQIKGEQVLTVVMLSKSLSLLFKIRCPMKGELPGAWEGRIQAHSNDTSFHSRSLECE